MASFFQRVIVALALLYGGPVSALTYITDSASLRTAVKDWCEDPTAAETTYGHISGWDTSGVTEMNGLIIGNCLWTATAPITFYTFNEDISGWDGKFRVQYSTCTVLIS